MKKTFFSVAAICLLLSCNNSVSSKKETTKDTSNTKNIVSKDNEKNAVNSNDNESKEKNTDDNNTKTLNDIKLNTSGSIKVSQAYLIYGDDESLVPSSNETSIGRPVKLVLMIDKGWKEENGEISIGASEKIETNTGQTVLSSNDLFQQYPSIKAEYGNIIKLKAVITEMTTHYDYFVVSFRVWDKKGDGEITGNYRLYIK